MNPNLIKMMASAFLIFGETAGVVTTVYMKIIKSLRVSENRQNSKYSCTKLCIVFTAAFHIKKV